MFSHITVGSNNLEAARRFYNALFAVSGVEPVASSESGRLRYVQGSQFFIVLRPLNGQPATPGNGVTIGLKLDSPEKVDVWHKAGLAHGGTAIEDPPGVRHVADMTLYLAYLRDPDGNKLCAFHKK